ncbi:MAG: PD40 domain-containing protein [Bacteroidetes bacterium]|nr:PD40 domain-containing protein [Bacteroidota bacterium]
MRTCIGIVFNAARLPLSVVVALLLVPALASRAQDFGKNKVQYRTFDWKYIQTDHFDIYFYDSAGVNLSRFTAFVAENALHDIQKHWRYRITNRIPIIVYNSKNDFQQTNVVSEYLPEGVGGVTELFKNRMTLPFEGDWEKFRHVVHHELVHAVLNDKFYGGTIQSLITNNIRFMLPIWMNEGLAEFESENGYDIQTDMFIRDAVIGEYLPPLEYLDGYFAYRGGQAFYWYVEQTYGREKIGELLNRAKTTGDLDAAFRGAFGKTVEEFSDQWLYDLKKLYWPDVADRKRPGDFAQRLTDHRHEESFFNTSPSLSPNGDKIAFISDRDENRSVYVMPVGNPKKAVKLVEGEENVDFEELHLVTPSIAWSPDGRKISLAVKSGGRDAIYIVDVETEEEQKLVFDLDGIYSVDWSPDGRTLAFQGIRGDHSDIFTFDLAEHRLTNLTDDIFTDAEPAWSTDGRSLYFLSDRRDNPIARYNRDNFLIWNYDYNAHDIFEIDVATRALRRVTFSDKVAESAPTPMPGGRLLYISEQNGIGNVYMLDSGAATARPITNSISGIEQLTASHDGGMLAFTAWNGDGQDIFLMRMPVAAHVDGDTLARTSYLKRLAAAASPDSSMPATVPPVTVVTPLEGYGPVRIDPTDAVPERRGAAGALTGVADGADSSLDEPDDTHLVAGDYAARDYKVKFTPDIIQATGNYTSFYGVQGVTQMLFSDMLGDHQIYLAMSLLLDLKNSDFLLSYSYLPKQIDYGFDLFHSSRFLYVTDEGSGQEYLTRFRQYGIAGHASKPFSRFNRLDMNLSLIDVSREPLEGNALTYQSKLLLVPSLSYVFDNTTMWAFNPSRGSRYFATLMASPKLSSGGVGFYTLMGDFRHYFPFGKEGAYSLGARFSGGASFGPNPQKFFVGGVENWFNYDVRNNTLPVQNAEDFTFLTPGYPLRGYRYNEEFGSKYMLGNLEFRFPLFRALASGPLPVLFQYISGVMFIDAGSAWSGTFHATKYEDGGRLVTDDLLLGSGVGLRAYVLGFPVRFDVAWRYNLDAWSMPSYYISLGYDF